MFEHIVALFDVFESGAEEWRCLYCNYRYIVQWPDETHQYNKIILDVGESFTEGVTHRGGKGGLQVSDPEITQWKNIDEDIWGSFLDGLVDDE